jgi:translation initiation factor 3 subunit K
MGREREAPQKPQQQQEEVVSYTVEQLVAVNPYNPDILPDLENYVNEQVSFSLFAFFFFFLFNSFFALFFCWFKNINK